MCAHECVYIYLKEIYDKVLAPATLEARNPDPEKPIVYFPSRCKNQEHHWYKFLSVNTGRSMSQRKDSQARERNSFLFNFYSIQAFNRLDKG